MLAADGGAIVNMASVAGKVGLAQAGAVAANDIAGSGNRNRQRSA